MVAERAATVPSLDSPEVQAMWEAAEAEQAYWTAHYGELLGKHPEQFVAVLDGQVVASSPDLQQLLGMLARDRIAPTQAWVRFITNDPHRITR